MKDLLEATAITLVLFMFTCLVATPFVMAANYLQFQNCRNNVTEMGREYRYDFINGCRIQQDDGTFVYWKIYRVNE